MSAKSPTPTTRKPPLKPKPQKKPKKPPTKTKRRPGRPSLRTPELTAKILDLVRTDHSFRQIEKIPGMPCERTLVYWEAEDEEFCAAVERARARGQANAVFSAMIDMEDKLERGKIDPQTAYAILRSKQWRAAVLNPNRYGSKQQLQVDDRRQLADAIREVAEAAHRARIAAKGPLIEGELVGGTKNEEPK